VDGQVFAHVLLNKKADKKNPLNVREGERRFELDKYAQLYI